MSNNLTYPSKKKIILITLFIIISLTSLLIVVQQHFPLKTKIAETSPNERFQSFYSQDFSITDNIVLVGSSHVGMINATVVQDIIRTNSGKNFTVYNIADNSNRPVQRIEQIEQIIAMKPKLIIYGISYRDLFSYPTKPMNQDFLLEKTKAYLSKLINKNEPFENPQRFLRLHVFGEGIKPQNVDCFYQPDTPFYAYCPNYYVPSTVEELKKADPPLFTNVSQENIDALSNMIERFHKENIKIIFFITPVNKIYLDQLPQSQKKFFDAYVKNLNEHGVTIYDFRYKYDEKPIWNNPSHIVANNYDYERDVAEMILKEIK